MCQRRAVKEVSDKPAKLGFPGSRLHGVSRLQGFTVPKSHSNGRQSLEWPRAKPWQPTGVRGLGPSA